jgi:23S rRNA pseudouridine1911/1915/1917 synthase
VPRGADVSTLAALRGFSRQALHAAKLQFEHPRAAKLVSFSAPIPKDILQLAQMLADDAD